MKVLSLVVFCAAVVMTSSYRDVMRRGFWDSIGWKKKSSCTEVSGQCYSSEHCCQGLVCASFDDYYGDKPEAPGSCVKEKDLHECQLDSDCEPGSRCRPMGRASELYCLPRPGYLKPAPAPVRYPTRVLASGGGGGSLGAPCKTSSDCRAYTLDGKDQLCCKDVSRGRLGVKRLCDRAETIGSCINGR